MRLACDIYKDGVTTSNAMNEDLKELILKIRPCKIIETGTHVGTGSTKAILDALKGRTDYKLITIEANPEYCERAKGNLDFYLRQGFVELINGITLPQYVLNSAIDNDLPREVITDHVDSNEYLKEIDFNVPMDQLYFALEEFNFQPDLVLLDSAGHLGTKEFHYLMSLVDGTFYLILDDTLHRKHYKTMKAIRNDERFTILKESTEKFGYAIMRYDP